ncbi:TylF/MycF/NovP-related O-methyltransferase [Blastochloris sulfoviridis]|uniref:TylF/MycF/NovP-related O-methyltransferase n=1 Tax=Blastochloris sulfoviridis TaxID=50712 RepID=UPI001478C989|nr:TylF/MycF/NovP-related O-methyltransferase [Blastochloris sulfoviridis]
MLADRAFQDDGMELEIHPLRPLVAQLKNAVGPPKNKKHEMLQLAFPTTTSWKVEGEYFEFGVFRGRAMIHTYRMARRCGRPTRFFAFDSFEGLPASAETGEKLQERQYACSQEQFLDNLKRAGVDISTVHCVKGVFDQSLTPRLQRDLAPSKSAIVWVDCDLYESTVPVLDFIVPFLQTGSIICFDDWFGFGGHPLKGEIRATNEWLARNPLIRLTHYRDFGVSGRSFVVHVSETAPS